MRLVTILAALLLLPFAAFAQSSDDSIASGSMRGSGGELRLITKQTGRLSGSLGIASSRSSSPFGGDGQRYDATLGGTLVPDRLWFFGSLQRSDVSSFAFAPAMPAVAAPVSDTVGKLTAGIGPQHDLSAAFRSAQTTVWSGSPGITLEIPSSFLSLHYTGVLSSNAFFTTSVTRTKTSLPLH